MNAKLRNFQKKIKACWICHQQNASVRIAKGNSPGWKEKVPDGNSDPPEIRGSEIVTTLANASNIIKLNFCRDTRLIKVE